MCNLMRVIHISDPHLTDLANVPGEKIRGKRLLGQLSWRRRRHRHLRANLDALCAAFLQLTPELVIVTGDLVHIGLPEELAAAAQWLRELRASAQVLVTPGNHDLYGGDSWSACRSHWADYLHIAPAAAGEGNDEPPWWMGFPSRLRFDDIHVYGLNSGLPTPVGFAAGELGEPQRRRLADLLAEAPASALNILALHHPPLPGVMGKRRALRDAGALQPLLGGMDMVLHGHGHWNRAYGCGGARIFATGSASVEDASFRLFDIHQAGDRFDVYMELRSKQGAQFKLAQAAEFSAPTAG